MSRRGFVAVAAALIWSVAEAGELRLPSLFSDHMVLQMHADVPVWGWADPGQDVEIVASWLKAPVRTTADETGGFRVELSTRGAGAHLPHRVEVRAGEQAIPLKDVRIGQVWVCSGQSNMEWPVKASMDAEKEIAAADHPQIRFFQVTNAFAASPREDCEGQWRICSPETVAGFSAVGYFFGRELERELDVPIGLIDATWGGTVAESWTSAAGLRPLGDFDEALGRLSAGDGQSAEVKVNHPTALYNGMIAPLQPYAIAGAIWYQGESNVGRGEQYQRLFPALIEDWRAGWELPEMPFYFVQIAPWAYPNDAGGAARLREAQLKTLRVPHTGMVVTTDIADVADIHPRNKQEVGRRLALWALADAYGRSGLECSGPLLERVAFAKGKAWVHFTHDESGLVARGGPLTHFTIAGPDRVFHEATAVIEDGAVVLSSPKVAEPAAVRFGFDATAEPNLFNGAGLPASPFRTDDWEDVP